MPTADIRRRLETSPVYFAGDLAFLETCAGSVRCIVQSVDVPGNGVEADNRGRLTVEITEDFGAYRSGEIVSACSLSVVPRKHRRIESSAWKVDGFYHWR